MTVGLCLSLLVHAEGAFARLEICLCICIEATVLSKLCRREGVTTSPIKVVTTGVDVEWDSATAGMGTGLGH
jgi:hypothetical protein